MKSLYLVFAAFAFASCSHHDATVLSTVREANAPNNNGGVSSAVPADLVPVKASDIDFHIRSREKSIEKFPCQKCHTVPLAKMKHDGKDGKAKAHWNVQLQHAADTVMGCNTCHDSGNLNQLRTLNSKPVAINESWQVCSQCHSKQAQDWAGGAHGKRVAGWAPPRVSQTCVECHNPHRPGWDKRVPAHVALTGVAGPKD